MCGRCYSCVPHICVPGPGSGYRKLIFISMITRVKTPTILFTCFFKFPLKYYLFVALASYMMVKLCIIFHRSEDVTVVPNHILVIYWSLHYWCDWYKLYRSSGFCSLPQPCCLNGILFSARHISVEYLLPVIGAISHNWNVIANTFFFFLGKFWSQAHFSEMMVLV